MIVIWVNGNASDWKWFLPEIIFLASLFLLSFLYFCVCISIQMLCFYQKKKRCFAELLKHFSFPIRFSAHSSLWIILSSHFFLELVRLIERYSAWLISPFLIYFHYLTEITCYHLKFQELLFRGSILPLFGMNWKSIGVAALIFGVLHIGNGRKYSFAIWWDIFLISSPRPCPLFSLSFFLLVLLFLDHIYFPLLCCYLLGMRIRE